MSKSLTDTQSQDLIEILKTRFLKNKTRHQNIEWLEVQKKLENNSSKLWSLHEMERTGGEPDVVAYDSKTDTYIFFDCTPESPKGRRSLCYDRQALEERKEFKPENSVLDMCHEMGIQLLTEEDYKYLQTLGKFDMKTSSWIETPEEIRKLGGAIFADFRYNTVFIYHNGASSYYAARGFRGFLKVS